MYIYIKILPADTSTFVTFLFLQFSSTFAWLSRMDLKSIDAFHCSCGVFSFETTTLLVVVAAAVDEEEAQTYLLRPLLLLLVVVVFHRLAAAAAAA
jgi:hypothetical protein